MNVMKDERIHKVERKRERNNRPEGLRGRDIGMYYKNLSKQNKKSEENSIKLGPNVSIPKEILAKVKLHLSKSEELDGKDCESNEFINYFEHTLNVSFDQLLQNAKESMSSSKKREVNLSYRKNKKNTKDVQERFKERSKLPVLAKKELIYKAFQENQVLLIAGSTGCGKTTQIPQILLDEFIEKDCCLKYEIVCTQPRRISTITIAERVAYERAERLGESVGYQIRLDCILPKESCSILYCTTGILLQKIQADPLLENLNAIVLDEIHERSVEVDLLMGLIKKILPYRPDLRVILMSATLREQDFSEYFDNCFTFYIDGTIFPVDVLYLEDILQETRYTKFEKKPNIKKTFGAKERAAEEKYLEYKNMISPYIRQLSGKYDANVLETLKYSDSEGCENLQFLEYLIFYICKNKPPGAILVFLPGYDKISKLYSMLQKPTQQIAKGMENKIAIHALHSRMPSVNQKNVFLPHPNGLRKIILSTNIAETSVTINDVVYVINTGRAKVSQYNVKANIQTLEEIWITKANTQQRKGRAGRVQPGVCYNLFTKAREAQMTDLPIPEILCTKLESIILNLKLLHISDVCEFMNTLLNRPELDAIKNGTKLLKRIGALDNNECITPLGIHLGRLPIDPQIGKMVLMSSLFRCFDPISSIAAAMSFKSPFYSPLGKEKVVDKIKFEFSDGSRSDHLLYHNVLLKYRESLENGTKSHFCYSNFLSWNILEQLEDMKQQFAGHLKNCCFLESSECAEMTSNKNSENTALLRAIIAAGLYPNMAFLRKARQIRNRVFAVHSMSTPEDGKVNFHFSSVNFGKSSFDSNYFVYFEKQKSNGIHLMDATMVFPMALLVFGDNIETGITTGSEYISVAKSYFFKCDTESSDVILSLRKHMERLMLKKALKPSPIEENSNDEEIVKAIQILLSIDEIDDTMEKYLASDEDDE